MGETADKVDKTTDKTTDKTSDRQDQSDKVADEATARLAAQLAELTAKLAARDAADAAKADAEAAKKGEWEALYQKEKAAREVAQAELARRTEIETARLAALEAANAKRLAALPAGLRDLVPPGLAPDAMAAHLARVEAHVSAAKDPVSTATGDGTKASPLDRIPTHLRPLLDAEAATAKQTPEFWAEKVVPASKIWQRRLATPTTP